MEAKIESLIAYAGKSTSRTITTFHEIIIIIVIIVIIIIDFTTQKHKYEGIGKIQLMLKDSSTSRMLPPDKQYI